jgi:hypothetical protein
MIRHDEPIPEGPEGDAERKRVEDFTPRGSVGLALWIMCGYRPDIAYQVGAPSRVAHCFNDKHIAAARHLLRYLRTTKGGSPACLQTQPGKHHQQTTRHDTTKGGSPACLQTQPGKHHQQTTRRTPTTLYSPDYGGWTDNGDRSTSAWLVLSNNTACDGARLQHYTKSHQETLGDLD